MHYSTVKPSCLNFRVITANFSGVRIFRFFMVMDVHDSQGKKETVRSLRTNFVISFSITEIRKRTQRRRSKWRRSRRLWRRRRRRRRRKCRWFWRRRRSSIIIIRRRRRKKEEENEEYIFLSKLMFKRAQYLASTDVNILSVKNLAPLFQLFFFKHLWHL